MRIINLNNISTTVGMPTKSGSLQHLQLAYREALAALGNLLTNQYETLNNTDFFILYGCINSGSGLNFNISAGAVYFNGEIYLVPAATFMASGGQTAVGTIVTSQYSAINADPVLFTDGNSYNVHDIRTLNFASGVSGSGNVDFADLQPNMLVLANGYPGALPSSLTVSFGKSILFDYSSAPNNCTVTFDFTGAIPGTIVKLRFPYASGKVLTVTAGSGAIADKEGGTLTAADDCTFSVYFMYNGRDNAGDHLVSYHVIQL